MKDPHDIMTPLFSCQCEGCREEVSYPIDMLALWNGAPICDECYIEVRGSSDPDWSDLPPVDPLTINLPKGYAVVRIAQNEGGTA